ncbi:conserved hypothetical protein [Rippkaea orientalis PCC 8801]|uniref:Phosphodiester glycosidase domain-containing protein n=1 Tax=Rippkaea orientalis (strain PCC 8801 / RF-1) TaxID=41431 RepID=B7JZ01_RIPO1|nr:phosphodiester glycosidase family protein [Rippkaea orientalis]ACK66078.1 conserved hypothetical protein [Rippkaea orientalis PCC 8801]
MTRIPWNPISLLSLSLVSTFVIYWATSGELPANNPSISLSPQTLPAEAADGLEQGEEIILNGKKFKISWTQWTQGNGNRIGISDIGAKDLLGLELLSTSQPDLQPVQWFATESRQTLPVLARFIPPYRYLDVTELIQLAGGQLQVRGNTLDITLPPARISTVREGTQDWGKRIVVEVDRPTFWQVSQAKNQGVVMISGNTNAPTNNNNNSSPFPFNLSPGNDAEEDDLGSGGTTPTNSKLFSVENGGEITKIHVNLPTAHGLKVFSLSNPNRIVIDVRPDAMTPKEIAWTRGITWRQQLVKVAGGIFPVHWLEIDGRSPNISLKPITASPNQQQGTAPLVTMAQSWKASAAINAGFFNRNNQLPLGAMRSQSRWLSGPILGRGAIAWNDEGRMKIGRLSWQETLVTSSGQRLPIRFLNSGYVEGGMARYTPDWGPHYTPLTDNETIILVQNNGVITQRNGGKAGQNAILIPSNGYLLTIRKNAVAASALAVGTGVTLESNTIPSDFSQYPHILGAGPLLVNNNRIVVNAALEQFSKGFQQQMASRSAIGMTNQGTMMLVAVHNRVGGRGATLGEMAQIMQQLGAVDALNLDGGSSTSLALGGQLIDRSPVTAARVHNAIGVFVNR